MRIENSLGNIISDNPILIAGCILLYIEIDANIFAMATFRALDAQSDFRACAQQSSYTRRIGCGRSQNVRHLARAGYLDICRLLTAFLILPPVSLSLSHSLLLFVCLSQSS